MPRRPHRRVRSPKALDLLCRCLPAPAGAEIGKVLEGAFKLVLRERIELRKGDQFSIEK